MSQNVGWPERWNELVDDLERQRQALQCEQERWAEWHAVQEEALLEQVRLLEERDKDLVAREQVLAETLRALEEDAILLDEKHQLLRQERRLFQEEMKNQNLRLKEATYHQRSARIPAPRITADGRNRYPVDDAQGDYGFSDNPMSQLSDEDVELDSYRAGNRIMYMREPLPNQHIHVPRSKPSHRQITSPMRNYKDYSYTRTPPSAPPMSDAMGAFEVRVNSPDNTRVHVTYRDQPTSPDAQYNPRKVAVDTAEYVREQAQLRRNIDAEKWQTRVPPPRAIEQRAELTTGNSNYSKVNAGIQASESIRNKVKALRDSIVPNCGGISEQSSSSSGNIGALESDAAIDRAPPIRISDIVRTAKPPSTASNLSQAQSGGNRLQQNSRSSSIEYKLKNLVDKLDR